MARRLLNTQRVVNLPNDPGTGTSGELYYNTTINAFKFYNGTSWTTISAGAAAGVYIGATAPPSPSEGDLWYNPVTEKLLIYYNSFWAEINDGGGGGPSTQISGATLSDAWWLGA